MREANSSELFGRLQDAYAEIARLDELKTPASRELLNITKGLLDAANAESERLRAANERLAFWMSAALDDSNVCEEMKADIRAWFALEQKADTE